MATQQCRGHAKMIDVIVVESCTDKGFYATGTHWVEAL
jgi:hypothetical protein